MTTTPTTKGAPQLLPVFEADNERLATALINEAIASARMSDDLITTACARLIAAAIHRGPTSALGQFAATGLLNQLQATVELWDSSTIEVPVRWWSALDLYLKREALDGAA